VKAREAYETSCKLYASCKLDEENNNLNQALESASKKEERYASCSSSSSSSASSVSNESTAANQPPLTQQDISNMKQMKRRTGMKSNMYASCSMLYWMDRNSV